MNPLMMMIQMAQRGRNPMGALQQMGAGPQLQQMQQMLAGKNYNQLLQMADNAARERGSNHDLLCHFAADRNARFLDVHDQISADRVDHADIATYYKAKVFQMLPHFRLSADSLDDGVLTGRHQGQRHHTFAFFLRYCD